MNEASLFMNKVCNWLAGSSLWTGRGEASSCVRQDAVPGASTTLITPHYRRPVHASTAICYRLATAVAATRYRPDSATVRPPATTPPPPLPRHCSPRRKSSANSRTKRKSQNNKTYMTFVSKVQSEVDGKKANQIIRDKKGELLQSPVK